MATKDTTQNTTSDTSKTSKTRIPTFNPEEMRKVLEQATAEAEAKLRRELAEERAEIDRQRAELAKLADTTKAAKVSMAGKSMQSIKNEMLAIKAFQKLGIKAQPHVDTFTFNRWISQGKRPKEGAKAVKAGSLRLFHATQVRDLTPTEKGDLKAKQAEEAKEAKGKSKGGTVIPMNAGPSA